MQWLSILFSFLEHGDCPDAKSADADEGDVSVQDTKSLRALTWQAGLQKKKKLPGSQIPFRLSGVIGQHESGQNAKHAIDFQAWPPVHGQHGV